MIFCNKNNFQLLNYLVPELDSSVPARRGHLGSLVRMPENLDTNIIMSLPLGQQLGRLPVPDVNLPVPVPAGQVGHLGAEVQPAGVARHHVTLEHLLPHLLEPVPDLVDHDLVVQTLTRNTFPVWCCCYCWHTVHAGI